MAPAPDLLDLDKATASEVKTKGWPGLMRKVRAHGAVVVTHHNHPEAVVVDAERYRQLVAQANAAATATARAQSLKALQAEFDAHLATLRSGDALAQALRRPARRSGKIALGPSR
ncbi:type II toxin-antitoxin system prevent-host-death family antitoxin [Luteimonas huabeiensis]|uniref:type II toxin-antitoxin system prevent-host-death family antitoxin n=1 Tax=Luteimonas huabeiensis TaxID=1244513 RepID=UPI000463E6C3|nr:type II toxin-antitoxin system prevent-host-death family antitoxin [Luteimonas huabeiensis]